MGRRLGSRWRERHHVEEEDVGDRDRLFYLNLPLFSFGVPVEAGVSVWVAERIGVEWSASVTYSRFEPMYSNRIGLRVRL